ncbi:DNA repair protein RecN [Denitrobaculum tricleocarpae]|uniref:DNA repair protein RecN n=1 Tax=Denitrobaculum tricleocarpae TaxID=2591009 RepID=A0A545T0S6_9PROT|nr:DNA repair protein RecN [Denitrobaculum tricleocarpae]TQV70823.1 DNA repair protein RecN [Denitrobaculum tricleocarpae]
MLVSLSIRDIVLIDRLDLTFQNGLCALTGETGAGKSILLDALGLAVGNRSTSGLVRAGAKQASVTAVFDVGDEHPATRILAEHDIEPEPGSLVLRRIIAADGRSRAYVNDQAVSIGLLRRLGDGLIEIQGQFEQRGLLDAATHRALLDAFSDQPALVAKVASLWNALGDALKARNLAEQDLAQARSDESYLRHSVEELAVLDPRSGEEQVLAERRKLLLNREQLLEAVNAAANDLTGGNGQSGAEDALIGARRRLERVSGAAGDRLDPALAALDRAMAETEDALGQLQSLASDVDVEGGSLAEIEERYFALRDMARKHGTEVEQLTDLRVSLEARLATIDSGGEVLERLEQDCVAARCAFVKQAEALSKARRKAAKALDQEISGELPPLKLDKASFQTRIEALEEREWGPSGLERISFEVATNPGAAPGSLARIASGGELARFLLALKVVLAGTSPVEALVFDEVDSGVGGATAHAVGERLARLARERQILVVTHSPQVAARADYHLQVRKTTLNSGAKKQTTATQVLDLNDGERREELARMLSGAEVTDEARAAADRLMGV